MTRLAGAAMIALLALGALPAAPSEAGGLDLFGGYSYTRRSDEALHGADLTATWAFGRRLGLGVDVGRHSGDIFGLDVTLLSLMAGPRVEILHGGLRPFVRAMAGGVRTTESLAFFDDSGHSETDFGWLAGGGFDWSLGRRWGMRLSGEYYRIQGADEALSAPRLALGVSYRFGGR